VVQMRVTVQRRRTPKITPQTDEGIEHGRDMVTVYVVEVFACSDIFDAGKDSRRIGPVGRICLTMVLDVLSSDQEVMVGE